MADPWDSRTMLAIVSGLMNKKSTRENSKLEGILPLPDFSGGTLFSEAIENVDDSSDVTEL